MIVDMSVLEARQPCYGPGRWESQAVAQKNNYIGSDAGFYAAFVT